MKKPINTHDSLGHLMRNAQLGDKQSYGSLLSEITPLLRALVRKRINNFADVEDVVQEILMSIHQASHTYDANRPFKPWMFTIARYRLNDYLRTIYAKKNRVIDIEFVAGELTSDEQLAKTYENREYINYLLEFLPKKQKEIVTMMKLEGFSVKETAKSVSLSESAVKVNAHRAYKALALNAAER